jgi:hypothetical protein
VKYTQAHFAPSSVKKKENKPFKTDTRAQRAVEKVK